MSNKKEAVVIRTFISFEGISSLDGFKSENPIDKTNYKHLIGDYYVEEKLKCCLKKENGNMCNTEHNFGFVAQLKDDTVTILGNCCARDKFDANDQIKVDRRRYLNEKKRLQRIKTVKKLLAEKSERLSAISEYRNKLQDASILTKSFLQGVGNLMNRKLIDMSRTGSGVVNVGLVYINKYVDEDGDDQQEITRTQTSIGSINGVAVFSTKMFRNVHSELNAVESTYQEVESIMDDVSNKEIDRLTGQLNQFESVARQTEHLLKSAQDFQRNDFSLFCFLVDDKTERFKAAKMAMQREGLVGGKDKAKEWLAQKEHAIRQAMKADKLEIIG